MTAVWTCASLDPFRPWEIAQARTHKAASAQWSAKQDLFTPAQSDLSEPNARIAVAGDGDAVAVWEKSWNDKLVQGATRPAGGPWSAPETISPATLMTESREVAADGEGNAVVVWDAYDGAVHLVQAAAYDAAGPQLRELEIPATGTVGLPLNFSVSPVDAWSAVQSVEWDFGDGKTATGETVTHAYRRPGTYAAQATATDALGNATRTSGDVRVRWPALPTQPPCEAQALPRP